MALPRIHARATARDAVIEPQTRTDDLVGVAFVGTTAYDEVEARLNSPEHDSCLAKFIAPIYRAPTAVSTAGWIAIRRSLWATFVICRHPRGMHHR